MNETMIAGIILFGVGVLVVIAGIVLAGDEGIVIGVITCAIGMVIMVAAAGEAAAIDEPQTEVYPLVAQITMIDREADVVECVDGAGNIWAFYGCEDWQEGDFAALLMNDNGTPTIYDDEIITARYAGTFEGWN